MNPRATHPPHPDAARPARPTPATPRRLPGPDRRRFCAHLLAAASSLGVGAAGAQGAPRPAPAMALTFDQQAYLHRWSRDGQHEFTPAGDEDLQRWRDMLTLNVHAQVRDGEALAELANVVLARYRRHGKVLLTRSTPRTPARPAEHLAVAVLGEPRFLEAVFARFVLHQGGGLVIVRSRRVHGQGVGPEMSRWLAEHGPRTEAALMAWDGPPPMARLAALPMA